MSRFRWRPIFCVRLIQADFQKASVNGALLSLRSARRISATTNLKTTIYDRSNQGTSCRCRRIPLLGLYAFVLGFIRRCARLGSHRSPSTLVSDFDLGILMLIGRFSEIFSTLRTFKKQPIQYFNLFAAVRHCGDQLVDQCLRGNI